MWLCQVGVDLGFADLKLGAVVGRKPVSHLLQDGAILSKFPKVLTGHIGLLIRWQGQTTGIASPRAYVFASGNTAQDARHEDFLELASNGIPVQRTGSF